jgi:O-antigen/teichoic acid export membrane protein
LKQKLYKIYNKLGITSDRTKNITKHVFLSFIYKGGSILASFLLVPLTINYLNTENYGIWLTLSSFISWFSFFDIGLGNGLRNKFAEAKSKGDMNLAKGYVSSAYFSIGAVSFVLIIFFIGFNFFIDWTKVFNISSYLQKDLILLMPIVFGFFCLQLVAKLITTIYVADQEHSTQGKVTFLTNTLSLLIVWLLTKTTSSSILIFGIVYSFFPVLVLIGFNLIGFRSRYKQFKPDLRFWRRDYFKDIFGLGFNFFIIQISGVIIFSTDTLLISRLLGPEEVVPYQLAFKYFGVSSMIFSIISTPFWSGFTEAYTKNDNVWIANAIKNLTKLTIVFILFVCLLLLFSNKFYKFWLGELVDIPFVLSVYMAIYYIQLIIITPYTIFINATGKIFIQTYQSLFSAIINIPISIYFVKYFNLGTEGIILGTIISLIPSLFITPIQTWKIINSSKNKFYNK